MSNVVKKSKSSNEKKVRENCDRSHQQNANGGEISMDFIFNLPKSKDNKKAILIVVDKLSKKSSLPCLTCRTQGRGYGPDILQ